MRRTSLFLAKTGTLFGVPAIALAQSKTPGTPTIPTGPALVLEASVLSGSFNITDNTNIVVDNLTFKLTPTKWETRTTPPTPDCHIYKNSAGQSSSVADAASATYTYSCTLGGITKNTSFSTSGLSVAPWSGIETAYTVSPTTIDLSSLPSTVGSKALGGTLRTYTLDLSVTKTGFTFDEKVKKTILCAENIAGAAFDHNVSGPLNGWRSLPPGTTYHSPSTQNTPELAIAYYLSGWQFAVAGPRPGKVVFRTPESAKSALTTKTVTTNSSFGKSTTPTTSTVTTDDLTKGWFDLAPLETVNSSYCKAW